jgi:hypothetical protein
LIVERVAAEDDARPRFRRRGGEKCVARLARRLLEAASGRMPWSIVTAISAVSGAWRARCSLVRNRRASESPPPETAAMTVPQPEKSIFENEAAPATLSGTSSTPRAPLPA